MEEGPRRKLASCLLQSPILEALTKVGAPQHSHCKQTGKGQGKASTRDTWPTVPKERRLYLSSSITDHESTGLHTQRTASLKFPPPWGEGFSNQVNGAGYWRLPCWRSQQNKHRLNFRTRLQEPKGQEHRPWLQGATGSVLLNSQHCYPLEQHTHLND